MNDRLSRVESEVEELSRRLGDIEARLGSLERGAGAKHPEPAEANAAATSWDLSPAVTLFGRSLVVLGGAYLIRALTESGALGSAWGIALGLGYALFWVLMADRAGSQRKPLSAAFHGAAAALVAFPLLWETTARFALLSPPGGAVLVGVVAGTCLAVAWRQRLRSFAWVTVAGATFTAMALLVATRELAVFSLLLVLLAIGVLWLVYHADWPFLHWAVAGIADLGVAGLTVAVLLERSNVSPIQASLVLLVFLSSFLSSFTIRMLVKRCPPGRFEVVQTGTVLLIGFGGVIRIAPAPLSFVLAVLGLLAGSASYFVALSRSELLSPSRSYFAGMGFIFVLLVILARLGEPTIVLAVAGLALAWLSSRRRDPEMNLHAAGMFLAAATGLGSWAAHVWVAPSSTAWPSAPPDAWVVVVATAVAIGIAAEPESDRWFARWRVARLGELLVLLGVAGAWAIALAAPPLVGRPGTNADPAILATLRTGVLSVSVVALAALGRVPRLREASWLVYPLLFLGGIKLLLEDVVQGRASTLFLSLGLYGMSTTLATRWVRKEPSR
ncbi:MAG TPA: hypothetical protein VEK15_22865 [Vicinamibacteria bacterium]|nr:hypothetical protein [Vicinamibacteria bacterium]